MFRNRARALPSRTSSAHPISAAGAVTYRTETVKQSREPTWNADFELPIFAMATVLYACSVCGVPCRFDTRSLYLYMSICVTLRVCAHGHRPEHVTHMHTVISSICQCASPNLYQRYTQQNSSESCSTPIKTWTSVSQKTWTEISMLVHRSIERSVCTRCADFDCGHFRRRLPYEG